MYHRLRMLGLLCTIGLMVLRSSAFAGELDGAPENMGRSCQKNFCFVQRELVSWGVVANGPSGETASQPGVSMSSSNLNGHDVLSGEYGTAPLSNAWTHNWSSHLESAVTNEVGGVDSEGSVDPSIVFGLKYSFKRFQLNRFRKSILSFMSDANNANPGRGKAVELYVDIP